MKQSRELLILVITILYFCLSSKLYSQTESPVDTCHFVVAYMYKCNTEDVNGISVTDSVRLAVQVGTKGTKCGEFYRTMLNDLGEWNNKEFQYGEWEARQFNSPTWYINYPAGEMRTYDQIIPTRYLIEGVAPTIKWRLESDTIRIEGYLCCKAVGSYAGRTWSAWYTEDIPSPAGPWKLRGLPGLIMCAYDSDNIHSFVFCGLLNKTAPIIMKEDARYSTIKQEKFIKQRNKILCNKNYPVNPRYYFPEGALSNAVEMWAGGPEPSDEEKYTTLAFDMIVPKTAHVYKPLELE